MNHLILCTQITITITSPCSHNGIMSTVTRLWVGQLKNCGLTPDRSKIFVLSKYPDQLWGTPLNTHLCVMSRSRIGAVILPIPPMPSWCAHKTTSCLLLYLYLYFENKNKNHERTTAWSWIFIYARMVYFTHIWYKNSTNFRKHKTYE